MPVIAFASTKGGSGKTTAAIALANAFRRSGLTVGLVDSDPQQNAAMWLKVLAEGAGGALDAGANEWSHGGFTVARQVNEEHMVDAIAGLAARHDIVLIDTQGSANQAMLMALSQSDLVIIPVQPSRFDTVAAVKTAKIAEQAAKMVRRPVPVRLLMSRTKPAINTRAAVTIRQELKEAGYPLMRVELMDRAAFQNMTINGPAPAIDSKNDSEANAARNMEWLAKEVTLVLQGKDRRVEEEIA
jgi:chromosome partitioning protein